MQQKKMLPEKSESEPSNKSPDKEKERRTVKEPRKFPMRPPAKSQTISKSPTPGNELMRQFSNEVHGIWVI